VFSVTHSCICIQGRIQDFKLGGAHLKKLRRPEGGSNIFGVYRVKNHDFTPKNLIFSNWRGRRENFWGISCEKSRSYAKKIIFFPILGVDARRVRPSLDPPLVYVRHDLRVLNKIESSLSNLYLIYNGKRK
jgi:hypothetical protein